MKSSLNNLYGGTDETAGSEINEAVSKTAFVDKNSVLIFKNFLKFLIIFNNYL